VNYGLKVGTKLRVTDSHGYFVKGSSALIVEGYDDDTDGYVVTTNVNVAGPISVPDCDIMRFFEVVEE
jgi:hypothetical protein